MKLRFGEIENVLQRAYAVPESMRSPFRSRLRHLFRVGLSLPGGNVGRRANFQPADLFKMAFAVELMQAGIPPEKAVLTLSRYWPLVIELIFQSRRALQMGEPVAAYLVAEPMAMIADLYKFSPETGESLAKRLADGRLLNSSRLLILNPAAMLNSIWIAAALCELDMDAFGASLDRDQQVILENATLLREGRGFVQRVEGE